jgi:hypothetical protein
MALAFHLTPELAYLGLEVLNAAQEVHERTAAQEPFQAIHPLLQGGRLLGGHGQGKGDGPHKDGAGQDGVSAAITVHVYLTR